MGIRVFELACSSTRSNSSLLTWRMTSLVDLQPLWHHKICLVEP